jgi:hypothetical protein
MKLKSLATAALAAGALALSTLAMPAMARDRHGPPDQIDPNLCLTDPANCPDPGHGGGHHHHHHGGGDFDFNLYFGNGYYGDPLYHPYYDDTFDTTLPMHCYEARMLVKRQGYRHVRTIDCEGRYYEFTGVMDGDYFRLRVNAYTGRIRARLIY